MNKKIQLNALFNSFLPDVFMYESYVYAIALSKINVNRTYWTAGTVNLDHDVVTQKSRLIKDKERLKFLDWNLLSYSSFIKEKQFSVVALCSIAEDDWNEKTRILHSNFSEVFKGVEFDYFLRGSEKGQISLDEEYINFTFHNFNYNSRRDYRCKLEECPDENDEARGNFFSSS